ncbi:hypothetical protein F4809DRAFT_661744 [Biscogniauxia mediterranea]|nr:hypothetical protein F4809DRAFT_661744 [Biscogniauxia mediterranea]
MSSDRDAVAVVELVFWPPCLLATVFVAATHIRRGDKSWLPPCMPLAILGIVRIVSAAFELAASSLSSPASGPFLAISLVLDDIAIGPLFLAMIGLLMRINSPLPWGISFFTFIPLQATTVLAAVLTALGNKPSSSSSSSSSSPAAPPSSSSTLSRAGAVLSAIILSGTLALGIISHRKTISDEDDETPYPRERDASVCFLALAPSAASRVSWCLASSFAPASASSLFTLSPPLKPPPPAPPAAAGIWLHFVLAVAPELAIGAAIAGLGVAAAAAAEGGRGGRRGGREREREYRVLGVRRVPAADETPFSRYYYGGVAGKYDGEKDGFLLAERDGAAGTGTRMKPRPFVLQGGDIHDPRTWGSV